MTEEQYKALEEFRKIGFGLANPGELDAVMEEFKRVQRFLKTMGGYDLAMFKLYQDEYSFELMKRAREMHARRDSEVLQK